ncbi:oligosaccharide flippase family protein [Clostridium lacusfryxellense]|uniref:oligosaccharide flippase family protein n=1 Tax=Clostridium lacusfryxellense TaxID=205328 RepID=UPI001C0E7B42|nr:oligosaccharide flippase family protein [Clostridium lacusfryxellense]MBU3111453.1 oligosaccharide flippase family protein [Clostridium lacusfryxellense]
MNINKSLRVIFVEVLGILIGILSALVVPKVLDLGSYGYLKTFTLYVGFAGMMHFGFSDGMYLILGGKDIENIKKEKIKGYFYVMLKIVVSLVVVLLFVSIFLIKDMAFRYFVFYILPFQVVLFISLLYRATGEFNKYVVIRVAQNIVMLASVLAVIFIVKSPILYMQIQVIGNAVMAIISTVLIMNSAKKAEKIKYPEIKSITSMGFTIMIANTVSLLFFTMDRWFVKFKFTVNDFAFYSFAVSMLSLFLVLVNSVTVLFYPYLAKNKGDEKVVSKVKKYIILICSFAPAGYFVLEFIVDNMLKKYILSLEVLGILIIGIPFICLTNVLYANLYKVGKRGKEYLFVASKMVVLAFVLNVFAAYVLKDSVMIAYATLITLIVWYVYSSFDFKGLEIHKNEIIHFVIYIVSYQIIRIIPFPSLIKAFIFLLCMVLSEYILFNSDFKDIISMIKNRNALKD